MALYTVLLYAEEDGGYSALVPLLDVATQGDTVKLALAMARKPASCASVGLSRMARQSSRRSRRRS
jgi:predicted RNase H-like HicB family nuclease